MLKKLLGDVFFEEAAVTAGWLSDLSQKHSGPIRAASNPSTTPNYVSRENRAHNRADNRRHCSNTSSRIYIFDKEE